MKIKADILHDYIEGKSINRYKEEWFFKYDGHMFVEPSYESEHRESVRRIFEQVKRGLKEFTPCNVEIWDKLFPNWQEIINDVSINLIVGYPEPFDATVLRAPDGKSNVVLDLGQWSKYEGKCDIVSVVHNLLTHELCHVCIGEVIKDIDDDMESSDYLTNLDANTFHEAFAHLISFEDKDINEAEWDNEEWLKVKDNCRKRMNEALRETDVNKQSEFLYDATCGGNYKDKYASMAGMFYLVDCWMTKSISGLEEEFRKGYHGFAQKTLKGYNSTIISQF